MRKLILTVLILGAIPVFAQNAFEGTWRVNIKSGEIKGNDRYALQDGTWHCYSCVPEITAKADGKPHKISGDPYSDAVTVKEVNDHTVGITNEKDGKPASTSKMTVSGDGKLLTAERTFKANDDKEGSATWVYDRVGSVPASGNKVSGTWHARKAESASDSVLKFTFKVNDNGLSMSDLLGDSYDAKLDGKDYPYKGDPGTTSVSLRKIGDNTIEETDKRNGQVISVNRMTVGADGKTMKLAVDDKLHKQTYNWTAEKE